MSNRTCDLLILYAVCVSIVAVALPVRASLSTAIVACSQLAIVLLVSYRWPDNRPD